jgi:uncharacterized protein
MAARSTCAVVFLSLASCLIAPIVNAAEPITGAFGLVLGTRFERFGAGGGASEDLMWFDIAQPPDQKAFERIRAFVAPLSYRIYAIRADQAFQSVAGCREGARAVFSIVSGKYDSQEFGAAQSNDAAGDRYEVEQKKTGRRINIRCTATALSVLYQDEALRDAAQVESKDWNRLADAFQSGDASSVPRLLELAAQGHMHAEFLVGYAFSRGVGVKADDTQAQTYYTRAARKGMIEAQYNLGTFQFERGRLQEAREWLTKAAEGGKTLAQAQLGQLYSRPGPLYDDDAAFKWFLKAAEGGHAQSQYNTCYMYGAGEGVPKDDVQAWRWCDIAATAGDDKAASSRDVLAQRMTVAQLRQARAASQEWLAAHRGK